MEYNLNDDGTGTIHKIYDRQNYLSRKSPRIKGAGYRGERLEQVIASNLDTIFVILSISQPDFNNKTLDRFLVAAESSHIDTIIIINKSDLDRNKKIDYWKMLYETIGYKVFITSVVANTGLKEIKDLLTDKRTLFWGPSGVGKSSILNTLFPKLKLKVDKISHYTMKGKHTTVTSNMIYLGGNTFIIDTPGIREIDPFGIKKEDLSHYYIDFKDFMYDCKFNTCTHNHEPGCAVREAVSNGAIFSERYESYIRLLETIEEDINF